MYTHRRRILHYGLERTDVVVLRYKICSYISGSIV